ncbi:hypothetical protein [Leucobacter soli]|uniref:hypothetical protein n=1 Tax=Leucobacter soli TaxID=2812850 RepID=UPI003616623F
MLVEVRAVSVNPVGRRIRDTEHPSAGQTRVLGWGAVGTIVEFGESVADEPLLELFALGAESTTQTLSTDQARTQTILSSMRTWRPARRHC